MKEFYNKLHSTFDSQEVKDLYFDNNIEPVKYIDIYAGQDYNPQLFEAHLYPALFVTWSINYDSETPVANVIIRLAYEQLRDFSNISANKEEALKFIDFIAITDKIIKTIESKNTSKLLLTNEELNIEETVIDVFTLTYRCNYFGKSKKPIQEFERGQINELQLKKQLLQRML